LSVEEGHHSLQIMPSRAACFMWVTYLRPLL